jgi:hypothetical protein
VGENLKERDNCEDLGVNMALRSTQPLTEMNTRNLPGGVKGSRHLGLTTSPPKYGSLDDSQSYGLPRPVTGIALPLLPSDHLQLNTATSQEVCVLVERLLLYVELTSCKGRCRLDNIKMDHK